MPGFRFIPQSYGSLISKEKTEMRKILLVAGLLLCLPMLAQAQDTPKAELFTGYSYLRFGRGNGTDYINANGFNASLAANVTTNVGLVADFAGHYGSISIRSFGLSGLDIKADGNLYTFLFGPRVSARSGTMIPFAHALFGGSRLSLYGISDTSFAFALGGGLDVKVHDKVAIRLAQLDYLRTGGFDVKQNSFRYSAGLVFRLGKK